MTKIEMPFKPEFQVAIRHGHKRMTSRNRVYGKIGDTFEAFGMLFQITEVFQSTLEDVATKYWELEGLKNENEFREVWKKIHPRRGFVPEQLVWVHRFIRIGGE
jgi:hypothetical protein